MPQHFKNIWIITDIDQKIKRAVKTKEVLESYLAGMYGFEDLKKFEGIDKFTISAKREVVVEKIELVDGRLYRHKVLPFRN